MTVGYYFDKFRGIASGISVSATAVGILSGSLIVQKFIDVYGMSGAFLLIGGMAFHYCVFGMLFIPPATAGGRPRNSEKVYKDAAVKLHTVEEKNPDIFIITNGDNADWCLQQRQSDPTSVLSENEKNERASGNLTEGIENETFRSTQELVTVLNEPTATTAAIGGFSTLQTLNRKKKSYRLQNGNLRKTKRPRCMKDPGAGKRNVLRQIVLEQLRELTLLAKNKAYLFHCASVFFANINISGLNLYLPAYAQSQGTSPTMAAALFVSVGILSLVSRLASGFLITFLRVNALALSVSLMGLSGAAQVCSRCILPPTLGR